MKNNYLEAGRIANAHGVRGLVKIEHWCDSAKVLASQKRIFLVVGGEYIEHKVISASVSGELVLMSVEGISSREDAIALKGVTVYLHRDDIPITPGAMFVADMIGLPVIDRDTGRIYGEISDVSEVPRGRLYTVKTASGDVYLPDVTEFIKGIDAERGMTVTPIPGFFEEE